MQFKVTNSEVEGQHALVFVTPLRIKKSKVLLAVRSSTSLGRVVDSLRAPLCLAPQME